MTPSEKSLNRNIKTRLDRLKTNISDKNNAQQRKWSPSVSVGERVTVQSYFGKLIWLYGTTRIIRIIEKLDELLPKNTSAQDGLSQTRWKKCSFLSLSSFLVD